MSQATTHHRLLRDEARLAMAEDHLGVISRRLREWGRVFAVATLATIAAVTLMACEAYLYPRERTTK